jgi:hypothetical protein
VTFEVFVTRFRLTERSRALSANQIRGALGAKLYTQRELYSRWFDPQWSAGPSGYRQPPRPFVLRCRRDELTLITFQHEARTVLSDALTESLQAEIGDRNEVRMPFDGPPARGRLRIEFVTPTALKQSGEIVSEPYFDTLIERLAERVRALGCLYQRWPADLSLTDLVAEADWVDLKRHEWNARTAVRRRSARSGHVHELRGYVGWAEYTGAIGRLLPLLRIGEYTGVGRNTVWGNGEIRIIESSVDE